MTRAGLVQSIRELKAAKFRLKAFLLRRISALRAEPPGATPTFRKTPFSGSSSYIPLAVLFHIVFLEGVYLDRSDQGRTPRFVQAAPPSDADMTRVLQKIGHRVIQKLCRLGYLEAGMAAAVATGYDPLLDTEPELARTMAASVMQRIAFGERAGEKVRRIGSGFGNEGKRPALTGPRCASVHGFALHANTAIPAHRRDQ